MVNTSSSYYQIAMIQLIISVVLLSRLYMEGDMMIQPFENSSDSSLHFDLHPPKDGDDIDPLRQWTLVFLLSMTSDSDDVV